MVAGGFRSNRDDLVLIKENKYIVQLGGVKVAKYQRTHWNYKRHKF